MSILCLLLLLTLPITSLTDENNNLLIRPIRGDKKIDKNELKERGERCKAMGLSSGALSMAGDYFSIAGDALDIIPVVGPMAKGFAKGFANLFYLGRNGLSLASTAADCDQLPFDELYLFIDEKFNEMEKKMEKMTEKLEEISDKVSALSKLVQKSREEMHKGFKEVIDAVKDLDLKNKIDEVQILIYFYEGEMEAIRILPKEKYERKLLTTDNVLENLRMIIIDTNILYSPLTLLFSTVNRIVENENEVPLLAIETMLKGTQLYVSVMSFLLEQHIYLSNYHYQRGNLDGYNKELDNIDEIFHRFSNVLVQSKNSLIDFPKDILSRIYVTKHDYGDVSLSKMIIFLEDLKKEIFNFNLTIITPENQIEVSVASIDKSIQTSGSVFVKGTELKYALQFKQDGVYSRISTWSSTKVDKEGNLTLLIPIDNHRDRLIFRRIGDSNAELVGMIKKSEIRFWDINRDLYNAAGYPLEEKAMSDVRTYMERGANIFETFENGRSAIHAAAQAGHGNLVKLLHENDCDIDDADDNGYTPLHLAAGAGRKEVVKYLVKNKANIIAKTKNELLTPLHLACQKGYIHVLGSLVRRKTVNVKDKFGFTPLHAAVRGGRKIIDFILKESKNKPNVNAQSDAHKLTPLHLAVMNENLEVVKGLLSSSLLDVNLGDSKHLTPLHYAALAPPSDKNLEIVKYLISDERTEINIVAENNWTPLHFALFKRNANAAIELLKSGNIDLLPLIDGNTTFLHLATATGQTDAIQELLKRRVRINAETDEGFTALHLGAMRIEPAIVPMLLQRNASINAQTKNGSTPLHYAAAAGRDQSIINLINSGGSVLEKNRDGRYPIHEAVSHGHLDSIKILLNERFETVYERDGFNQAPFDIAVEKYAVAAGLRQTARCFCENRTSVHGSNVTDKYLKHRRHTEFKQCNEKDETYKPTFNIDVEKRYVSIIHEFVRKKLNLSAWFGEGRPPLHIFAKIGSLEMVEFLLNNQADPKVLDFQNDTFFDLAAENGHKDIVEYIYMNKILNPSKIEKGVCKAIACGHLDIVQYFVQVQNKLFCDPLHTAALEGQLHIVQYMVEEENMDVDNVTNNQTALCKAVKGRHDNIVTYLVGKRANIHGSCYINSKQYTPVIYATEIGYIEVFKSLVQSNPNQKDSFGYSPLFYTARYGCLECARYLIENKKVNIDEKNNHGDTALHAAYEAWNFQVAMFLKENGAATNIKNDDTFNAYKHFFDIYFECYHLVLVDPSVTPEHFIHVVKKAHEWYVYRSVKGKNPDYKGALKRYPFP